MGAEFMGVVVDDYLGLAEILKTGGQIIVLFYASWCPFCEDFLPIYQQYSAAACEGRRFVAVRDDEETIGGRYAVDVYPTVLCFENGAVAKRLDGELEVGLDEGQLAGFLRACPVP